MIEFRINVTVWDDHGCPYAWTWLYEQTADGQLVQVPVEGPKTHRLPFWRGQSVGAARREWQRLVEGAWLPAWVVKGHVSGVRQWEHDRPVSDAISGTEPVRLGYWPEPDSDWYRNVKRSREQVSAAVKEYA